MKRRLPKMHLNKDGSISDIINELINNLEHATGAPVEIHIQSDRTLDIRFEEPAK